MNWLERGLKRLGFVRFPSATPVWSGGNGWGSLSYYPYDTDYRVDNSTSSAVMACINWVCRTFPEAPIQVVKVDEEGKREAQRNHPMVELLKRPNSFYSGHLLWNATLSDWNRTGDAYWRKLRNGSGGVVQLWWLPEQLVEPRREEGSFNLVDYYEYSPNGTPERIAVEDIVHFRHGSDPNNMMKGLSPLKSLIREVYTDEEAAAFSSSLLKNMGVPGIVIAPKGDGLNVSFGAEDAAAIKAAFKNATTGTNRGDPVVIGSDVTVSTMSFNPQQMNLKDMRRIPEERITAVLGIPAIVAGLGAGLDRSTFANYAEAREAAYESNIIPTQRLFAADLDTQLLPDFGSTDGLETSFDTSNVRVLQEDENAKAVRWGKLLLDGVANRDEARSALGLPPEEVQGAPAQGEKSVTILGYHIDSGVVSRNEARAQLGLPPEDEGEDVKLRRLQTKLSVAQMAVDVGIPTDVALDMVGLEVNLPDEPEVTVETPVPAQLTDNAKAFVQEIVRKSVQENVYETKAYGRQVERIEQRAQAATLAYLIEQYERGAKQLPLDLGPEIARLWNKFYPLIIRKSWDDVVDEIGASIAFDLENVYVQQVLGELAKDIKAVADTTKDDIRRLVGRQAEEGWSADDLAKEIRNLKETHAPFRARMIARTETGKGYNLGTLSGYQEAGVTHVEVFDGDDDEPCKSANGARWTIEEARKNPLGHPNCVRAFAAVVE